MHHQLPEREIKEAFTLVTKRKFRINFGKEIRDVYNKSGIST